MQQRAAYQIGDQVQAYDGHIGTVVYTHTNASGAFPDDQRVWIKRSDGSIMDALADYFRTTTLIRPEGDQ